MAKIYTDKEIKDAANAGVFIKNPTPAASSNDSLWGKNPITSTPIQANQVAGISSSGISKSPTQDTTIYNDKSNETKSVKKQVNAALEAYKKAQEQQKAIDTQKYITDSTGLLNQLTEAQKASRTNALKDAYNKSLTGLDTQANTAKTNVENTVSTLRQKLNEIRPQYQQNRNQLSAQTAQQEQALRERAAADGNIFGGQYIKNSIGLQSGLQRGINDQNLAESNTVADYANQENVLNSNLATILNNIAANKQQLTEGYGNNEQAIIKEVEAAKLAELMNLQKQGMDYNIQNNQISSNNSQQAFANAMAAIQAASNVDQQAITNAINQAQVTGYYNPNSNAGNVTTSYDPNNIQATIDQLKATNPNDPNIAALENIRYQKVMSDPALKAKYGDQYKTTQQKQIDAQQKLAELDYAIKDAQQKALIDPNSTENKIKAEQLRQLQAQTKQIEAIDPTLANQESQLKLDQIRAQIAQINASTANIGANNDLERKYKEGQINLINKQAESLTNKNDNNVDDYSSVITKFYTTKDDNGDVNGVNKSEVTKYLASLKQSGVSENILQQLAAKFGINLISN